MNRVLVVGLVLSGCQAVSPSREGDAGTRQRADVADGSSTGNHDALDSAVYLARDGSVSNAEVDSLDGSDLGSSESGNDSGSQPVVIPFLEAGMAQDAGSQVHSVHDASADGRKDGSTPSLPAADGGAHADSGGRIDAEPMVNSTCGDGITEGYEECDDGANHVIGDGCSPGCQAEPDCGTTAGCVSRCGDGLLVEADGEECDDGNAKAHDGCGADCKVEAGFSCVTVDRNDADFLELPVLYRDFRGVGSEEYSPEEYDATGHPDFENESYADAASSRAGWVTGMVERVLGGDGAPAFAQQQPYIEASGSDHFNEWFHDVPLVNFSVAGSLRLTRNEREDLVYANDLYFPLDKSGWVASGEEQLRKSGYLGGDTCWSNVTNGDVSDKFDNETGEAVPDGLVDLHNYSFTSEIHFWFVYDEGEKLTFVGDDDVWLFVDGRLMIDLGGLHTPLGADLCQNTWDVGDSDVPTCVGLSAQTTDVDDRELDLVPGRAYEVALFQAERQTCGSSFALTLHRFKMPTSVCKQG